MKDRRNKSTLSLKFAALSVCLAFNPSVIHAQVSSESAGPPASSAELISAYISQQLPNAYEVFWGSEQWRWVMFGLTLFLLLILKTVILKRLLAWATQLTGKTETTYDEQLVALLTSPVNWLIVIFGLYSSLSWLTLPAPFSSYLYLGYRIALIGLVTWAIGRSMSVAAAVITRYTAQSESKLDDYLAPLITRVLKIAIYGVGVMLVLQEFGINVAGIIAGLGVGGLAFALAAQDTLANWFGALMIYTDQPFKVDDWIKTSQLEGVVEQIGLRSTRVRTFANTVVSIPNRQLANEVIENFSRMKKRRISFKIGVTYDTTPAMLEESVERVRDILRTQEGVDQSYWLVKFTEFGDSALEIFVYYFTLTTDWQEYLSIKQEVNLRIMQRLNAIGVNFAFPSMSIYQERTDSEALAKLDAQARRLFAARIEKIDHRESRTAPSDDNADG